jgi:DNA-binding CsgD family transcriptional regulator
MSIIWTDEEDKKLTQLINDGKTYEQASEEIGRSYRSVKHRVRTLKLKSPIYHVNKPFWTEEIDHRILELRSQGHTFRYIADDLGKSESGVADRFYALVDLEGRDNTWPPPKTDPMAAIKVNYAEHDLKMKPMRTVIKSTDHSQVRSLVGNSSDMCAR